MATESITNMTDETISELQDLIQLNLDSRDGYRESAEKVDLLALKTKFERIAEQRAQFAADLQHYVTVNDKQPRREGSTLASFHRAWLSIRETLSGTDMNAVLKEVQRGEEHIKEAYEKSLKSIPGNPVNDVLQKQYAQIKRDCDEMQELAKSLKS